MGGDAGGKGRHSGAARAARLVKHPLLLANALALMAPAALLAGAYGFQYFAGLPPCEMCLWQRYPHFVAVALALARSEEHTSELQSLMRISYAVFCLKNKKQSI